MAWSAAVVLCAASQPARADDEAAPALLAEPTELTRVVDAFDGDDPFDLDVHVGFVRSVELASIAREVGGDDGGTGTPRQLRVADSERVVNELQLGLDAGLYHDLMFYTRVPLVLSDTRSLSLPASATCEGKPCANVNAALSDSVGTGPDQLLFSPAFSSRTRSGVPAIDFGLAWGITNQYRTASVPTWVVAAETRVSVGSVLAPCAAGGKACEGGISRGTARVRLESRWSYRFRHVEPFLAIGWAHEWATSGTSRFTPRGELPGYADAAPPDVTDGTLGVSIVPWEERGRFQRFAIDLSTRATYVSAGRDYTPLFDALGTSSHAQLTATNDERITGTTPGRSVTFTGLTNADAHARLRLETAFTMQAAQYVRFRLGAALGFGSSHLITNATRCSDSTRAASSTDPRAGACAPHLWNPLYRAVIDLPGQRFLVGDELSYDLFARATGQF